MAEKKQTENAARLLGFTKEQLVNSERYADRKDLIGVLLDGGTEYTVAQVDEMREKYLKGKVI